MAGFHAAKEVPVDQLRWRLDPATLGFETTADLEPLKEIVGQQRGVEAFRFGMGITKKGYNVFVTGKAGSGRLAVVRRLLQELTGENNHTPDDLCYVNNFSSPEAPVLLSFEAGMGREFKKNIHDFIEELKKEVPQFFESQEYINRKKEIMDEYEKKGRGFFKSLEQKVKEEGFALVDIQVGQAKRPEVMPLVDGSPTHIDQLEAMVEKGRFPRDEFEEMKGKYERLRKEIDQIFLEIRDMQKEVQKRLSEMDRLIFTKIASQMLAPLQEKFPGPKVEAFFTGMLEDMGDNLQIFSTQSQQSLSGYQPAPPQGDLFQPYQVNLLVDNSGQKGPPVIIESYPTYRNLFGSIERIVDRSGIWRTDFSKIKAGSFVRANGGYLVLNLQDVALEPGVWPALKRALKTRKMEIETYDPFYLFTTTGLKPEPIETDAKVVIISNAYYYHLLRAYDEDLPKIFKVRADFDTSMDKDQEALTKLARFIRMQQDLDGLQPFDRTAVAAVLEQAVRMTERQEKISTSFPAITDLLREANYWALQDGSAAVKAAHVDRAIEAGITRSNLVEEHIQEMIDRGTLLIDVDGEVPGQVNGLAVYNLGDHIFGKPTRITVSTSMGRAGIISIEREADLSGNTHSKGVLILSGYLRKKYAQDKPLTMSASIAFEQSYGGVEGDSASSAEVYALLSSLSGVPLKQSIAVTGSVNQKGEIQAIGGVNQKIEGFFDCCRKLGMTGGQGVLVPRSNIKDLMLRKDVVESVQRGEFHIFAVSTIDEGMEILTDKEAGAMKADGTYPRDTINALVNEKLRSLALGLKEFGEKDGDKEKKEK